MLDLLMLYSEFSFLLGKYSYDIKIYVSNDHNYFEEQSCGHYYHLVDAIGKGMVYCCYFFFLNTF